MLATGRGKVRGRCPECSSEVWLIEEELGDPLACNVCGTTFRVERKRRRRYIPGYWKLRAFPPTLARAAARAQPTKTRRPRASWVISVLLLLLLALLFLLLGGSPTDNEYPPMRLFR